MLDLLYSVDLWVVVIGIILGVIVLFIVEE